ncbi:hypothetical protein KIW84_060654 [Lathyrus oleraceus]|uniref:Uncharacterized protein n=1 Tax=Pisum sativum TaxID=3888 RepID=A0A9D5A343_PEA|nr:hypothetical protein KIW84_060654 [Pisum sativum]
MVEIGMLISQYRQFLYLCNMVLSSFQSVEEERLMRKLYEVMSIHGITKQIEDNSNVSHDSAGAEQFNNNVNTNLV